MNISDGRGKRYMTTDERATEDAQRIRNQAYADYLARRSGGHQASPQQPQPAPQRVAAPAPTHDTNEAQMARDKALNEFLARRHSKEPS